MVAVAVDAIAAVHQLFHQAHARADARVIEDDRVVDRGAAADVAVGADHRRADDRGAVLDLRHATHIDRARHRDLVPVSGHIEARVDARTHLPAGDLHLAHISLQHAADGLPVVGHLADVHPLELHRQRVERRSGVHQLRKEISADVERLATRDEVQHLRLEDVDAGVDHVAGGFLHRRLLLEGAHATIVVGDDDPVAAHLLARHTLGDQAGHRPLLAVTTHGFGEIKVDQRVAAEHHEGVVEEGLEILDALEASGRTQGIADQFTVFDASLEAVGDLHPEALAVAEIVLDLLGQMGDVDHDFVESVLAQQLQQKLHHRFLQDRNHRLGCGVRDRTHPRSLAGRQDHRLHWRRHLTDKQAA